MTKGNPKDPSREVLFRQTKWTSIVQTAAAIGTVALLFVMYLQFRAMRHEQSISLRPYVQLETENFLGPTQVFNLVNPGQDNEQWELAYWARNDGRYPARKVKYHIEHNASRDFKKSPSWDKTGTFMIAPNMVRRVDIRSIWRSDVLAYSKRNESLYRHFYVQYEDDDGNVYNTKAIWYLSDYEVGKPIRWELVDLDGD